MSVNTAGAASCEAELADQSQAKHSVCALPAAVRWAVRPWAAVDAPLAECGCAALVRTARRADAGVFQSWTCSPSLATQNTRYGNSHSSSQGRLCLERCSGRGRFNIAT